MPRLFVEGADEASALALRQWNHRTGNGSSGFDLCKRCARKFNGKPIKESGLEPYNGEPSLAHYILSVSEGEHPSYDDEDYTCACCRKVLRDREDG
jgi:hypothetical protein